MRFRYGDTRFVYLSRDYAYKLGRVRPLRVLARLIFVLPFFPKRRKHFFKKYGSNFFRAVFRDLFFGMYANREEYAYYQTHKDDQRLMPTLSMLWNGLVNVQYRGSAIKGEHQYVRHMSGRIVCIDYGHWPDEKVPPRRQKTILKLVVS